MKTTALVLATVGALAVSPVATTTPAKAWHGGWGWGAGAVIGSAIVASALVSPWYYRPYYYEPVYPTTVIEVAPPAPTVYYQQPSAPAVAAAPADSGNWWYYCNESKTYYPYVKECPSPWQRVAPQAPAR